MNNFSFLGRLGADPTLRNAGTQEVASLRCAVSTTDRENDTVWVTASVWGKPAQWCAERLRKGDRVLVSGGELRQRNYTTKTGEQRTSLEVGGFGLRVHFIEKATGNPNKPGPVRPDAVTMTPNPVGVDDDIPF